jgi:hypothetical protein
LLGGIAGRFWPSTLRRADCVEGVGLAAGATFTAEPADLEHLLPTIGEEAGQTRAEGAASFDRERPPARRVLLGEPQRLLVASGVCSDGGFEHDHTGAHIDDPDRVRVSVRVDTDDLVQLICEHPDRPPAAFDLRQTGGEGTAMLEPGTYTVQVFVTAGGAAAETECPPKKVVIAGDRAGEER